MNKILYFILITLILTIIIFYICKNSDSSNSSDNFNNLKGYNNYAYKGQCNLEDTQVDIICLTKENKIVSQIDNSIRQNDILKLYNDITYTDIDKEELPDGGLLISMITNNYACNSSNYGETNREYNCIISNENKTESCVTINECNFVDFKDIKNLLINNSKENLTSCYAINTTYIRKDLPTILFGPNIEDSSVTEMNIGLILDIRKLRKYIGCMSIIDSASVGRYNHKKSKSYINGSYIPEISDGDLINTDITDNDIQNNYEKLLNSIKGNGLAQAGCGLQTNYQGSGLSGIYKDQVLPTGKVNKFRKANTIIVDKYSNDNSPFKTHNELIYGQWGTYSLPLKRTSWKYFVKLIKQKVNLINKYKNSRLWEKIMKLNNSGTYVNKYFENEVDIFIPNKSDLIENQCEPSDEFTEVWKSCVVGIFTNNRCLKDIKHNKPCDNCGKLQSFDCTKNKCCCNKDFNENLVKNLVYKFNGNSNTIINGYVINDDFNPSKDFPEPDENGNYKLNIRQITDCKSYINYPIKNKYTSTKIPKNLINLENEHLFVNTITLSYNQYLYKINNTSNFEIAIPNNFSGKYIICIKDGNNINNDNFSIMDCDSIEISKDDKDYYQIYLNYVLSLGIGIIHLYNYGQDNLDTINNTFKIYIQTVFRDLYSNNFADNNGKNIKFIYDNICVVGHSNQAQNISKFYNYFPTMTTSLNTTNQSFKFPIIKCGVIIGGGTMSCYYNNNELYCPSGTEPLYDNKEYNMKCHPYTLLLQSDKDTYIDSKASEKYYNSFTKNLQGEYINSLRDYISSFNISKKIYCHYVCNNKYSNILSKSQFISIINFTKEYM